MAANKASDRDDFRVFPSRLEIVSLGEWKGGSKYFIEWFPFNRSLQTDGSDLDRSGRFENLFVSTPIGKELAIQLGQFRPLIAIDPNRRLAISEPFGLSSSLPGRASADLREQMLRGFSPSFRSPTARISWVRWDDDETGLESWQAHAAALFPGEFSIPTTDDGRRNASFEFEGQAKGMFIEVLRQATAWSASLFHFLGDNRRRATGIAGTFSKAPWSVETAFWTGSGTGSSETKRSTFDLCFSPSWIGAYGLRFDKIEGEESWLVPYASFHAGGKEDAWRFAVEARLRQGTPTVFALEIHFLR